MAKKKLASLKRKEHMTACHARAQDRHKRLGKEQAERQVANRATKASGGLTPWEEACKIRYTRHLEDKKHGRWVPAERNSAGFIMRTTGKRTWWEDPGLKERKHYLKKIIGA